MEGKKWLKKLSRTLRGRHTVHPDKEWPDWYQAYWQANQGKLPPKQLLSDTPVVILDAETTGLNVQTDRMISIGGLRVYGNSIHLGEKFEAYLPTPSELQASSAVAIHGIVPNSQRYTYSDEPTLLAELVTYLKNTPVVGHHIGFDLEIINRSLKRHGAGPLLNRTVDTAQLAKRLRPAGYWTPIGDYSLDTLARRYGIPLSDRHTALGDCYITAVLWLKLLTRLAAKVGHDLSVADL